jgi:hypothetical protein
MARLFITPREINFIADITAEIIKDVAGQFVYLYPISEVKTAPHDVYNESVKKIFDQPIKLDALVSAKYEEQTKINEFGVESVYKIDLFVQYRDLVNKGIEVSVGDFFSYSDILFEITNVNIIRTIYGQAEHKDGVAIKGTKAREDQLKVLLLGPTDIKYADDDAVQKTFYQQRGDAENPEGATGDRRELVEAGVLEKPLTGIKEVSERGGHEDGSNHGSAFYDE